MKKTAVLFCVVLIIAVFVPDINAQTGIYIGPQAGISVPKPTLDGVELTADTTFLYGLRLGVKIAMVGIELNYFQAAHNLDLEEVALFGWNEREVDYNYLGLNLKWFFPIVFIHPYLTVGYGYYTADLTSIDKDTVRKLNVGAGIEIHLGKKFSVLAEGKYQNLDFSLDEMDFNFKGFTFSGGLSVYF
ncbi:MAG: porin family protein [Candidatus Aminicenantes bacterium]|nr:porin family protein [Candidatus Aminicenantes bacterium]HHF51206.1 porin family protein [Candidatus Aminicenantes bacterium]